MQETSGGDNAPPPFHTLRLKRAFESVLIARLILSNDYAYQFPAFLAECVGSDFDNGPRTVPVIDLAVFVSLYEFMLELVSRHSCMRLRQCFLSVIDTHSRISSALCPAISRRN